MSGGSSRTSVNLEDMQWSVAWKILRKVVVPQYSEAFSGNPTVLGVEAGVREVEGELAAEPSLKVFVQVKGETPAEHVIPERVEVETAEHGLVRVRTDVVEWTLPRLNGRATRCPSPTLVVQHQGVDGRTGGACAVLRSKSREYVVSAAHTFDGLVAGVEVRWPYGTTPGRGLLRNSPGLIWPAEEEDGATGFLDACLVEIIVAGDFDDPGSFPNGTRVVTWSGSPASSRAFVCGIHGVVPVTFSGRVPIGLPVAMAGRIRRYWRLLTYRFDPGFGTKDGDSGSAVLTPTGALVGLHLGTKDDSTALVLCAGDVLSAYRRLLKDSQAALLVSEDEAT